MITLVDVSGNNASFVHTPKGAVAAVKAAGHRGIMCKATEGRGYVWQGAATVLREARVLGLDTGLYHFAKPDTRANDAVLEARHFVDVAADLGGLGNLPPWLDVETATTDVGTIGPAALVQWVLDWCHEYQALTGGVPCIYTGPGFWGGRMAHTNLLDAFPLVVAQYPAKTPSQNVIPNQLGTWVPSLWQYTNAGTLPGIDGHVDVSRWLRGDDGYERFAGR